MPTQNFDTLSASNPYRKNIDNYQPSFLQKLWMSLGGRTQYDAWRENMQVQADEYDAALAQKQFDTEYNDPQSQVARMKAAGLNPDIDPSTINSGSAASMGEDPSIPMQSSGEEGQIGQFISTVVSCFSSALGMVSTVQGIHRNHLQNSLLDLEGDERISDLVKKMAPTFVDRLTNNQANFNVDDYLNTAYGRAEIFARKNLPRKYRDKFNSAVRNFFSSAPGEATAYNEWYKSIEGSKDFYRGKNTFYSPDPKTMERIYSIIGSAEERIFNLSKVRDAAVLSEETAEADYKGEVFDSLDPKKEAASRNAGFDAEKNEAEVKNILRGTVNDILSALKSDDSEFSGLFGFLLRVYSMYLFTR